MKEAVSRGVGKVSFGNQVALSLLNRAYRTG